MPSAKCFIKTGASEDISGTEAHARTVLQAWLDTWVAGGDMAAFKRTHPEADAKMTTDAAWASSSSAGKKLVRHEVTHATSAAQRFRFAVTAGVSNRGRPETEVLSCNVLEDRTMSGGRWCVIGG